MGLVRGLPDMSAWQNDQLSVQIRTWMVGLLAFAEIHNTADSMAVVYSSYELFHGFPLLLMVLTMIDWVGELVVTAATILPFHAPTLGETLV